MSVIGSNILAGASGQGGGYNLTKSLRFRSSAGAYLNRTPASAGNRKTWTWSGWVKLGSLSVTRQFFGTTGGSTQDALLFNADNQLVVFSDNASQTLLRTAQLFRDPSAWYHVVVAVDTTQATSSNRVKIYVNGVQVTAFEYTQYPSPDFQGSINNNVIHYISSYDGGSSWLYDGYLAEVNFIGGTQLTPSSFGETSTTTGVWIPKKYSGTYGTNGFYLPFTDTASTSTLGTDFSGNSNTWTVNNISLTSGSTYDSMTDVPTLTSATAANYAVLNPLDKGGTVNPKNGNLGFANTAGTYNIVRSTVGITSGKWYFEYTIVNSASIGGGSTSAGLVRYDSVLAGKYLGQDTNTLGSVSSGTPSLLLYNGTNKALSSGLNSFSVGAVIQYAYDADAGKLWVGVNNSWDGGNDPSTGSTPTLSSGFAGSSGPWFFAANGLTSPDDVAANFGQRPFAYTPPTDFKALNTFNLPTPTIGATASTTANKYFDISTYSGNGSTQTITNSGSMQPDLVWIKSRLPNGYQHVLQDVIRGTGQTKKLYSSLAEEENGANAPFGHLSAFNSNGFSVSIGSTNANQTNASGQTYVGWQWKANSTGVSNTDGSIPSTVSANTTAGFSIVTYTSPNNVSNQTVGHGLGVKPSMIIVKNRDSAFNWDIYHSSLGYNSSLIFTTAGTRSGAFGAEPNNLVFTTTNTYTHNGTDKYVAYCFAPIAGYSAFGSYTGNGDPNGTFVYLGFRPRFIILKRTNIGVADAWIMMDTATQTYNVVGNFLQPSQSDQELYAVICDFLSNGFKLRQTYTTINTSNGNYIYMAFAENPFKYANAR
jgi:hypothetical protein